MPIMSPLLQFRFDFRDPILWNLVERPGRDARFHRGQRTEQRFVCFQIAVMPPADRHFPGGMRTLSRRRVRGQVFDQAARIIVRQPIFQVMQPGKIFARALAVRDNDLSRCNAATVRRPIRFRFVQHARESERDFEKRPAIHSEEIHRGRFNVVVDLESEMFVASADQTSVLRWRCVGQSENLSSFPLVPSRPVDRIDQFP